MAAGTRKNFVARARLSLDSCALYNGDPRDNEADKAAVSVKAGDAVARLPADLGECTGNQKLAVRL